MTTLWAMPVVPRPPSAAGISNTSLRRPALDGVRALAVIAVAVYHFGGGSRTSVLPGGFLGVDIFFVLSGYLITGLLLGEHSRTGSISLGRFWARRARRLLPALCLVLLAVAVWVWWAAPLSDYGRRRADVFWTLGYLANWHLAGAGENYFASYGTASPLRHTWSLAVEEQFYLLWPLLVLGLMAISRTSRGRRLVLAGAAILGAAVSAIAMALEWSPASPSRAYYGTEGRVQELFVGALLAVLLSRSGVPGVARLARLAPAGLVLLVVAMAVLSDADRLYYVGGALAVSLATAGLLAGLELRPQSALARAFSWRPAVAVGRISYGLYLWHWPVAVALPIGTDLTVEERWTRQLLRVVVTGLLAWGSYRWVERPILDSGALGRSPWRVATLSVAVAGLVVAVTVQATALPEPLRTQLMLSSDRPCPGERIDRLVACVRPLGTAASVDDGTRQLRLAVMGDSLGRALAPGLDEWAREEGTSWLQAAWGQCPPTGLVAEGFSEPDPTVRQRACREQAQPRAWEALYRYRPDVVLVSEFTSHYKTLLDPSGDPPRTLQPGTPEHADALSASYLEMVDRVASWGGRVVFIELPPPGQSVAYAVAQGRLSGSKPGVAPGGRMVARYNGILHAISASRPGYARTVTVTDLVCPDGSCSALGDDMVIRVDGVHYSTAFSIWLVPRLLKRAGVVPG